MIGGSGGKLNVFGKSREPQDVRHWSDRKNSILVHICQVYLPTSHQADTECHYVH